MGGLYEVKMALNSLVLMQKSFGNYETMNAELGKKYPNQQWDYSDPSYSKERYLTPDGKLAASAYDITDKTGNKERHMYGLFKYNYNVFNSEIYSGSTDNKLPFDDSFDMYSFTMGNSSITIKDSNKNGYVDGDDAVRVQTINMDKENPFKISKISNTKEMSISEFLNYNF